MTKSQGVKEVIDTLCLSGGKLSLSLDGHENMKRLFDMFAFKIEIAWIIGTFTGDIARQL